MSILTKILEKLGIKKHEVPSSPSPQGTTSGRPGTVAAPATAPARPVTVKPVAISEVDVVKKLEGLAAKSPLKLNWKTSIADLLYLLGLENSYEARKELALELGCPPEFMHDSAKMNTWLHKTVLRKIAENGGNIPQELLD